MKFVQKKQSLRIIIVFLSIGVSSKDLYVSPDGNDQPHCGGINSTCRTINFTAVQQATPSDKINIHGKFTPENIHNSDKYGITVDKNLTFEAYSGRPRLGYTKEYFRHCFFHVHSLDLSPQIKVEIRNMDFQNICIVSVIASHVVIESCTAESNGNNTAIEISNKTTRAVSLTISSSVFIGTSGIFGAGKFQNLSVLMISTSFVRSHFGVLLNICGDTGVTMHIRNSTFRFISLYAVRYHETDPPNYSQVQINVTNSEFEGNAGYQMWDKPSSHVSVSIHRSSPNTPNKLEPFLETTNQLILFFDNCKFIEGGFGIKVRNTNQTITISINRSIFYHLRANGFRYYESYPFYMSSNVSIKIINSRFMENGAPNFNGKDGDPSQPHAGHGGIAIRGPNGVFADVLILNSNFFDNHAQISGGAVYIDKARVIILNCTFTKNYAGIHRYKHKTGQYTYGTGGAIFLGSDGSARIQKCRMKGNYATYGSAVFKIFGYKSNLFEFIDVDVAPSTFSGVLSFGAVLAYPPLH